MAISLQKNSIQWKMNIDWQHMLSTVSFAPCACYACPWQHQCINRTHHAQCCIDRNINKYAWNLHLSTVDSTQTKLEGRINRVLFIWNFIYAKDAKIMKNNFMSKGWSVLTSLQWNKDVTALCLEYHSFFCRSYLFMRSRFLTVAI